MDSTANVLFSFNPYINFHHITYAYNHLNYDETITRRYSYTNHIHTEAVL
jgi:hypothetical protein